MAPSAVDGLLLFLPPIPAPWFFSFFGRILPPRFFNDPWTFSLQLTFSSQYWITIDDFPFPSLFNVCPWLLCLHAPPFVGARSHTHAHGSAQTSPFFFNSNTSFPSDLFRWAPKNQFLLNTDGHRHILILGQESRSSPHARPKGRAYTHVGWYDTTHPHTYIHTYLRTFWRAFFFNVLL